MTGPKGLRLGLIRSRCLHQALTVAGALTAAAGVGAIVLAVSPFLSALPTVIVGVLWLVPALAFVVRVRMYAGLVHLRRVDAGRRCYRLLRPRSR
ncbi:hypothetical protein [Actinomadura sp. 3N508]|uniref:hypothetical protein n=1 Tax=Actinomadura sp. 3N508 TaxID=3375153 RepID=UPI003791832B